jgi:hypothetical protein
MFRTFVTCMTLLLVAGAGRAGEADEKEEKGEKVMGGMSIVGNDDAPKSLVIVPWKSSGLGDTLDVSRMLDDGLQPVDRDVFMRELDYYQIRTAASGAGSRSNTP